MIKANILVNGLVQNVGFHEKIKQYADNLGISGYIWNNYDGSVEIDIFLKTKVEILSLLETIKTGTESSSINEISVNVIATDPSFDEGFEIINDE